MLRRAWPEKHRNERESRGKAYHGRECREAAHINQKELAAQIGIARETIGKLERGDNQNPCYRLVYEVASYFGKPVEEIFQWRMSRKQKQLPTEAILRVEADLVNPIAMK